MSQFFTYAVLTATVASAIQLATPFLLAALGETMGQRSGVINLGVDGIMLLGAFGTYYAALKTGSLLLAVLVGIGIGAVMGLRDRVHQRHAQGRAGHQRDRRLPVRPRVQRPAVPEARRPPSPINALPAVDIPLLDRIPAVGGMFFNRTARLPGVPAGARARPSSSTGRLSG